MAETVSSKFDWGIVMKFIVYTLLAIVGLVLIITNSIKGNYSTAEKLMIIALLCLLTYSYIIFMITQLIALTTANEGIIIKSLLSGKQTTILYEDISHITSLNVVHTGRDGVTIIDHRKLKIELINGEVFSFTDMQFNNYDELRESIRRHRFHLD